MENLARSIRRKPGCKRVQYVTFSQCVSGWVFWLSPSSSGPTLAMLRMLRSTILESLSLMVRLIQAAGDSAWRTSLANRVVGDAYEPEPRLGAAVSRLDNLAGFPDLVAVERLGHPLA